MEGRITGPFSHVLKARREEFNTAFSAAVRANRSIEPEDVKTHLFRHVAPLVNRAAESGADPHVLGPALYHLSLSAFSIGALGRNRRYPAFSGLFADLFPRMLHLLSKQPHKVGIAICNALFFLYSEKSGRPEQWMNSMSLAAPFCENEKIFLDAGKAAAWKCGLPQFRNQALALCKKLPFSVFAAIFSLPDDPAFSSPECLIAQMEKDPWFDPARPLQNREPRLALVGKTGGFLGFGGFFPYPPRLFEKDGQCLAYDGKWVWRIRADVFGVALHRISRQIPGRANKSEKAAISANGTVSTQNLSAQFSVLKNPTSHTICKNTVFVSLPMSHYIFIVAPTRQIQNRIAGA